MAGESTFLAKLRRGVVIEVGVDFGAVLAWAGNLHCLSQVIEFNPCLFRRVGRRLLSAFILGTRNITHFLSTYIHFLCLEASAATVQVSRTRPKSSQTVTYNVGNYFQVGCFCFKTTVLGV